MITFSRLRVLVEKPTVRFLVVTFVIAIALSNTPSGSEAFEHPTGQEPSKLRWVDIRELGVEGQAWDDTESPFDRFPARAKEAVRPAVWNLSKHSAGLCVRFASSATALSVRWTLTSANLAMPHMPSTGVSGIDLYVRNDQGNWDWLACARPTAQSNEVELFAGLGKQKREYLMYLPLYNGVSNVELGVADQSEVEPIADQRKRPIVFYGTSITQGGCASRPGMVHTALLGRWLDRPVINLGFSGNGRMEAEVAKLMAEIDACLFVIDCLPNLNAEQVTERTASVVGILREAHPQTPILLVEDRSYTNGHTKTDAARRNVSNRTALREQFNAMTAAGAEHLHYLEGDRLLGDDSEGTVDGSHPTDLGFYRQALAFRAKLQPILDE